MYLIGILAAFISPAAHSLSNIFDSYIIGNLFKKTTTAVFYANITNILGPVALLTIGPVHLLQANMVPYAILIGVINVSYLFPYYIALKTTDTSIVAALFSLERVFIPLWAYLIVNEIVRPAQYMGLGIIIVSSLILNLTNAKSFKLNRGFWLMFLAALLLSFESVLYKKILQNTDWISAAFWCAVVTFSIRWGVIFYRPFRQDIVQNFSKYKANFPKFCFIEIFDQLGNLAPVFALSIIPVLVETSISSTQSFFVIIYSFLLAKIFGIRFKENLNRKETIKKLICFILIAIGVNLAIGL